MKDTLHDQLPMPGIDPLHGRHFAVRKRDGRLDEFNEARIFLAIESAFKAAAGLGRDERLRDEDQSSVKQCADSVTTRILSRAVKGEELEVEKIQDAVEEQLMLGGHIEVARRYILYREDRRRARAAREKRFPPRPDPSLSPAALAAQLYRGAADFCVSINEGEFLRWIAPEMLDFDLEFLARQLRPERDALFSLEGLRALCHHYLLREGDRIIETPQTFWMRVAMGLALNEGSDAEAKAVEFYETLSTLRFVPSDAILRHAGSPRPALTVCPAVSSAGSVEQVMEASGATCVWLEPWHGSIAEFLLPGESQQNFTKALWLPDLFLQRVQERGPWTLFDPAEAGDLHELHGTAFEDRYRHYEDMARAGRLQFSRVIRAENLWRDLIASISQTGQPAIGFKDAVRLQGGPNSAAAVHHGGGAVGIYGAVNLPALLADPANRALDHALLRATLKAVIRMLDNARDLSVYPSDAARAAALDLRGAGLGMHGFDAALERLGWEEGGPGAAEFADRSAEAIAWFGILASTELAAERGPYRDYEHSSWSRGEMPLDALGALERGRAFGLSVDRSFVLDWNIVRALVARHGVRHSAGTAFVSDPAAAILGIPAASGGVESLDAMVECAARRQKWVDHGPSLSFPVGVIGPEELSRLYFLAWQKGLKSISHAPLSLGEEKPREVAPDALHAALH